MPALLRSPDLRSSDDAPSLAHLLLHHARMDPERPVLHWMEDGESVSSTVNGAQLIERSESWASFFQSRIPPRAAAIIALSPGSEFLACLIGCWLADRIAIPCYPPSGSRHRRRLDAILSQSPARWLITDREQRPLEPSPRLADASPDPEACLIQFTSGSTRNPKGVCLQPSHLVHQLRTGILAHRDVGTRSMLSWLPPYHDLGLILYWLLAPAAGIPLYAFLPEQFARNPLLWLHAISRYRIHSSGAPNFALDACSRLAHRLSPGEIDLSSWQSLPCGAERIRTESLDRFTAAFSPFGFSSESFRPGYGLAEAALMVTVQRQRHLPRRIDHFVSCGTPIEETRIRIVPLEHVAHPRFPIGEIQVHGPSVSGRYYPHASALTPDHWLATGDLGWLDRGELFVYGRLKETLIFQAINHAPEDLESTVRTHLPELAGHSSAAVSTDHLLQRESFDFFQEIPQPPPLPPETLAARIRRILAEHEGLSPHRILFVRSGSLPRTTSGKIQRLLCHPDLESGRLRPIHLDSPPPQTETESTLADPPGADSHPLYSIVAEITGKPRPQPRHSPAHYGIQSIEATQILRRLEIATGQPGHLESLYSSSTFADLALLFPLSSPSPAPEPADSLPLSLDSSTATETLPTPSQERMAFLHRLQPESAAYHVFGVVELTGNLDLEALNRSWLEILTLHPILRSRHHWTHGRLHFEILPASPQIKQIPATGSDPAPQIKQKLTLGSDPDATSPSSPPSLIPLVATDDPHSVLREIALHPFHLENDSPVRLACIRLSPQRHLLALCAHHVVIDGYSIRILLRQWSAAYRRALDHHLLPSGTASPSYFDYTAWLHRHLASPAVAASVSYWKRRLRHAPAETPLPHDFRLPSTTRHHGAAARHTLSQETLTRLHQVAREHQTTPAAVLLTAFQISLAQHGAGLAPVIAIPSANRQHPASRHLIGTFVNTLPFHQPISLSSSFGENLRLTRSAMLEMLEHQDAPFERIIEAVQPDRSTHRSPLAQVMFDHQEFPWSERWSADLEAQPFPFHRQSAQFELSLLSLQFPHRHEIQFEYQTDLFLPRTIESWLHRFLFSLETFLQNPDSPLSSLPHLTARDIDFLASHGRGPQHPLPPPVVRDAILENTRRFANSLAIADPRRSLTYADLGHRIPLLARHLQQSGIRPGDRVPVLLPRETALLETLLALWHLGAAYLPLDPSHPKNRILEILSDARTSRAIVDPGSLDLLPPSISPVLLPATLENLDPLPPHPLAPHSPAYLLYTSGSTGKPKGVLISHRSLANFIASMARSPGIQPGETIASLTTASFDISGLEWYLPLCHGATIDLIPSATARDANALKLHLETRPPDLLQATPATWRMLETAGYTGHPRLRILCGGEALDPSLARFLLRLGREVWNLYGPTETTIWSTLARIHPEDENISIGRPIHHTFLRIVSADGQPTPPGVVGELWIGGDGVALGYWNRPELDRQRFTDLHPDPISPPGRYYRTGDLARYLPDGSIECLGRTDGQIKVRGFRVELAEIESALTSIPGIRQAVAILDDTFQPPRLIALVVADTPDPVAITAALRRDLPDYMIPAPILPVPELPLTGSGKIDRRESLQRFRPLLRQNTAAAVQPPQTPLEQHVARIWQELLRCGPVNRHDDFFHLGGHSLLAAQMIARIESEIGRTTALAALFRDSTLAGFSAGLHPVTTSRQSVVLHSPSAEAPNLFWIHTLIDAGNGLLPYRELVSLLDQFRSVGIACPEKIDLSIRELAAHHVTVILDHQPSGPYHLAGFCFGGNLSVEIARQLEDLGHRVETLILLESAATPSSPPTSPLWHISSWRHLTGQLCRQSPQWMNLEWSALRRRLRMKHRAVADRLQHWLQPHSATPPDLHSILDLDHLGPEQLDLVRHLWTALHRHRPVAPRNVACWLVIHTLHDGWLPKLPGLGWSRLTSQPLECHGIPGRHETFLRDGSTAAVAAILRRIHPSYAIA